MKPATLLFLAIPVQLVNLVMAQNFFSMGTPQYRPRPEAVPYSRCARMRAVPYYHRSEWSRSYHPRWVELDIKSRP